MATYAELQAQIAALTAQAEAARKAELNSVIADIKKKMADYGLTLHDLDGRASSLKGSKVAPKYRNPKTGATWSGRGKRPNWLDEAIAEGNDISAFFIG